MAPKPKKPSRRGQVDVSKWVATLPDGPKKELSKWGQATLRKLELRPGGLKVSKPFELVTAQGVVLDGDVEAPALVLRSSTSLSIVVVSGNLSVKNLYQGSNVVLIVLGRCEVPGLFFAKTGDSVTTFFGPSALGAGVFDWLHVHHPQRRFRALEGNSTGHVKGSGPSKKEVEHRGVPCMAFVVEELIDWSKWKKLSAARRNEIIADESPYGLYSYVSWNKPVVLARMKAGEALLKKTG